MNVQEANAWNGLVASLQATQSKQGKLDAAKKQHRPKLPDGSWSGTVLWNNAWDDALRKEAARPQHVSAQAQPEELAGKPVRQFDICLFCSMRIHRQMGKIVFRHGTLNNNHDNLASSSVELNAVPSTMQIPFVLSPQLLASFSPQQHLNSDWLQCTLFLMHRCRVFMLEHGCFRSQSLV